MDVGPDVEVKLGEVGLHDPHAGVGKLDDIDVVVGDAAKLVGKKVTARVTALADGLVWAELLTPAEEIDEPLTAEGEAERPTRVKKTTAPKQKVEPEGEAVEEADEDDEAEETAEGDESTAAAAKKRTRRGSRGGRNRKKKTATVAGTTDVEFEPGPTAESEPGPTAPVIHLPDRELTDEDDAAPSPAKKRTRRGSRGGKNRRKKTATATATAEAPETEAPEVEAPEAPQAAEPAEPSENGDWGYTPMSQWGMDDDAA